MKDATGELSMTAVAVVAIAAIAALFSTLIWPTIKQNILRSTFCASAFNCDCSSGDLCDCQYCPSNGETGNDASALVTCDNPQSIKCSANDVN